MNDARPVNDIEDDEIDIGQIMSSLWAGKWLIMFVSFITGALGIAYAFMIEPMFEGKALLQIEVKSSGFSGLSELTEGLGGLGGGGAATSTELELLKSRKVILPAVEHFKLAIKAKPLIFPLIGGYFYRNFSATEGFGTALFSKYLPFSKDYAWGGESIEIIQFDVPNQYYGKNFEIIKLVNDQFILKIGNEGIFKGKVGQKHYIDDYNIELHVNSLIGRTGTYFSLVKDNPILAVNSLIEELSVAENGKTSGIVGISLNGPDKDLIKRIIDYVLVTYQQQNVDHNNIESSKNIDFVAQLLPEAKQRMQGAEQAIYDYRLNNKTIDLTLKTQQLLDKLLTIEEGLNELRLLEPEFSRKFKKEHPLYVDFIRKFKDLETKKAEIEIETAKIPTEQFNVFRLQRDVELNQTIYLQMLNRHEGLKIIQAGTSGSIRVIDSAVVNPNAVTPKKRIVAILSVIVGMILSIGWILLKSLFKKGIRDANSLEQSGYEILASVDNSLNQVKLDKQKLRPGELRVLAYTNSDDLAIEGLRNLRTSLNHRISTASNKLIMIASANDGEGKSFVAQNLAALFAQSGKKTLLVDANMRHAALHDVFGLKLGEGLSNYINDDIKLADISNKTRIDNLEFVSAGSTTKNAAELLMNDRFEGFCKKSNEAYEFVIIDSPSILGVTDAAIIGAHTATTVMVARQYISELDNIDTAVQKLKIIDID
ncbi:MAG: polysaccharide biosynthesis tyrosine autokinase, partial [Hyphomicrobiales bacterium]